MARKNEGVEMQSAQHGTGRAVAVRRSVMNQVLVIIAELFLTLAAICGLYILWQEWWTGVESAQAQNETVASSSWTSPDASSTTTIAKAQQGDAPVEEGTYAEGDLVAEVYIPRFGAQWHRTVVEGTTLEQLNKHGLGHYTTSQMPGELGNFAIAGHRNGYGQPLGDVDKLQEGDTIIVRTEHYWYVYHYTSYTIVLPEDVSVVAANPENPGAMPTKRMITLTTCEPKYTTPTHRWISYGELKYWAKVADGVPEELTTTDASGNVTFTAKQTPTVLSRIGSLKNVIIVTLLAWAILFVLSALIWRWPHRRAVREGRKPKPSASIYGGLLRLHPGVAAVRWIMLVLLLFAAACALLQWGFPWAASHISFLQQMSNFVAVD